MMVVGDVVGVSEKLPSVKKCPMCGAAVARTKHGAGKARIYCGDNCKAAAWRVSHGQDGAYYKVLRHFLDTPLCGREGCNGRAERSRSKRRAYKMYCSAACKQKAVRQRVAAGASCR